MTIEELQAKVAAEKALLLDNSKPSDDGNPVVTMVAVALLVFPGVGEPNWSLCLELAKAAEADDA